MLKPLHCFDSLKLRQSKWETIELFRIKVRVKLWGTFFSKESESYFNSFVASFQLLKIQFWWKKLDNMLSKACVETFSSGANLH